MSALKRLLGNERGSVPFWESLALKVVSFLLALILWVTFLGLKREEVHKRVKLEPMLAPGVMITNRIPTHIDFTLSGPRLQIKMLDKKINPIRPDFRRNRESTIGFSINEELLGDLPKDVRVVAINPTSVLIRLEEVVERYLPVSPTLKGVTLSGFEIASVEATPTKIAVTGPKGLLGLVGSIGTEAIDIEGISGIKEVEVAAEVDSSQGFSLSRENTVKVRIKVRKVSR
jgi:YbbR domain-containing protein